VKKASIHEIILINRSFPADHFEGGDRRINMKNRTYTSTVKKIDEYERIVFMTDGTAIPINEIISIDGQIFEIMCNG